MTSVLGLILVVAGACVGSFANVVAWRLPREESVVWPGSHCPKCGQAVRWHDNVPVLGWVWLRGRCRDCHQGISSRYPFVEFSSALLWLSALWGHGLLAASDQLGLALLNLLAGIVLISVLLPLVLIDIDHLWLPEPLCRIGVLLGLAFTGALYLVIPAPEASSVLLNHLLAASAGLLALEGLSALAERMLGQPALGLGDAKLAAVAGAWLGLGGVLVALAIAVFSGAF
ncbi:prepilin peptidase, partial [Synechococcus sp. AH-551-B05]